ncbi:transposase [Desulforhabdus sp. TSK]|uniref:IS66 family transposase n=1 Tax=Desulforhabdus sp. TSK TaxID=2925014 RepID=UPI0034D418A2
MRATIQIPNIPEEAKSELVVQLLEIIKQQAELIQELRDEIARLKGQTPRPKIAPSRLEQREKNKPNTNGKKRPGSDKRQKTSELMIHAEQKVTAENIPEGSTFKGYKDFIVQDLRIEVHNTRFRLECWQTPDGHYVTAPLPPQLNGKHFGTELIRFVLYQYHHCHVTQPLLLEQLSEMGVDISIGQLNNLLIEDNDVFHLEKDAILATGLEVSTYVNVDDTGARHQGKNGYCTHIGNEWFSWFESTSSKSRINFLRLLRCGHSDYVINADAVAYWKSNKLPRSLLNPLSMDQSRTFDNDEQWDQYLKQKGIKGARHIQITTEGALIGSIIEHGVSRNLVVVSDDAGQFNVLLHALCWIHAERSINKITPVSEKGKKDLEEVLERFWQLYKELKAYKADPQPSEAERLDELFDDIFTTRTSSATLNNALKRIYCNKSEMLLVLRYPEIPLHNNLSENGIRDYVKKRKISGSTRSEAGRRSRDTFATLKKTCRKLGITFWQYLQDRMEKTQLIPSLSELIRNRSLQNDWHISIPEKPRSPCWF